jgi:CheY-like chemotaxis protein
MARLVVISKGLPSQSHELGKSWVTIGRADGNSFQISESSVSGRHCEVKSRGDELIVRDLLSLNGTFVGGKKITEAVVKSDGTFCVGEVELRFDTSAPVPGTSFSSKMLLTKAAAKAPSKSPPASAGKNTPSPPDITGTEKHHVLFIDDSLAFLETFGELCSGLSNQTWKIHSAATADDGLAVLKQHPIGLVVVDIGLPRVDGLQLLGILSRHFPEVKLAVLTGKATEANRMACLSKGAELFLEKPVTTDGIGIAFNLLNELISRKRREGSSDTLRPGSLPEIIQVECVEKHSAILEIHNQRLQGRIYIETGAIVHAEVEALAGEKAFYKLLSLADGEFRLKPFQPPSQRTIQDRWESLLREATRVCDEETVGITKPPAPDPVPANPSSPPAVEHNLGDDIVVVATYDGKWTSVEEPKK